MHVSTPSVLRFLCVIRHESPCYNHVFTEKAQHLQRWIPLRTFTRGRLVSRQPWAIKRTTPTALHGENIHHGKCNHWNADIKSTALHHEDIFIAKYILWNTDIKHTALYRYNIHNGEYIHRNIGIFCYLLIRILASIVLQNARINAVGVVLLIAQGCQTIVQATLG